MPNKPVIIAIDGYSSTGKSSFAKLVAKSYSLLYLDSGALYRAVTLLAMENGLIGEDGPDMEALLPLLEKTDLHFRHSGDGRIRTFVGDRDVEDEIRTMEVSQNVSSVAARGAVRAYVDGILHEHARHSDVVMDGRDIGTTVFPDAGLKIFMTADPEVRAGRRALELRGKGQECDLEQVLENLRERDWQDSHREVSPLVQAPDAVVLDNTRMTMDQQMEWIGGILKERFNLEAKGR